LDQDISITRARRRCSSYVLSVRQGHPYHFRHHLDGGTFLYGAAVYLPYRSTATKRRGVCRAAQAIYGDGKQALVDHYHALDVLGRSGRAVDALRIASPPVGRLDARQASLRVRLGGLPFYLPAHHVLASRRTECLVVDAPAPLE